MRPISEGIVALLEPFIDTVVICTMTALVIVITGYGAAAGGGAEWANAGLVSGSLDPIAQIDVTSKAFESVISWFPMVLGVAVILFALSTMISWSYYGPQVLDLPVWRKQEEREHLQGHLLYLRSNRFRHLCTGGIRLR